MPTKKNSFLFEEVRSVLLIHAAGMGMSGLARILLSYKWIVFGWDDGDYPELHALCKIGLVLCDESVLPEVDFVVYSELMRDQAAALRFGHASSGVLFPMYAFLDKFTSAKLTVGVAGSYGKTTVVAMISSILDIAGLMPSVLAGGQIRRFGANAIRGTSNLWILEVPEARGQLTTISCAIGIILNIEAQSILGDFQEFAHKTRNMLLINGDDKLASQIQTNRKVIYYGFNGVFDYTATILEIAEHALCMRCRANGYVLGEIFVPVFGEFNKYNALAAVALATEMGIDFSHIQRGLAEYAGVPKRGEIKFRGDKHCLIMDIAHHPQAIEAVLAAGAKLDFDQIIVVYHPHMYSEISEDAAHLVNAFLHADWVLITDVQSIKDRQRVHEAERMGEFLALANDQSDRTSWVYISNELDIMNKLSEILHRKTLVFQLGMYMDGKVTQYLLNLLSAK